MEKKKKGIQSLTAAIVIFVMTVFFMFSLAGCSEEDNDPETSFGAGVNASGTGMGGVRDDSVGKDGAVTGTKQVIDAQFDEAYPYSEGFAIVGQDTGSGMKYNYIDLDGNYLLQDWVDIAYSFSESMACVGTMMELEEGDSYYEQLYRFGYVDTTGQMVVEAEYIGSKYYHPLCFYQGYAEVQYYKKISGEYSSYYHQYCNVIDHQGNRLFDFDVEQYDDYGYGGYGPDYRLLTLNWQGLGWSDYCYYNRWMCNYVDHPGRNSVLMDGTTSYLVGPDGSIIKSVPGSTFEIDDGLYSISNRNEDGTESTALYDAELNLIREGSYYTYGSDWFEELVPFINENGWSSYLYRILDRDFQPVTGELYSHITQSYKNKETIGYIVRNEQMVWKYLDKDFHEVFIFDGEYDYVDNVTYSYSVSKDFIIPLYWGRTNENSTTVLLDEQGRVLRTVSGSNVSYQVVNNEILLERIYGQSMTLVDYMGNALLEIPLNNSSDIEATEDTIRITGYTISSDDQSNQTYYVIDIAKVNGQWEMQGMQEIAPESLSDDAEEEVLAENDESRIWGMFVYDYSEDAGPVSLEDASGKVLESSQTALSLVEDNLYLVAGKIQHIEDSWKYEAVEMYLQNTEKTLNGEVFEKLGLLSEDRIAFRENGKWGYLELVRETP